MRKLSLLAVLILAACGEKHLSEADFKAALDRNFEKSGPVCVDLGKSFPADLNQIEEQFGVGREFAAFERAGLMTSTSAGKSKRYDVNDAGRKFYVERESKSVGLTVETVKHGFMCFADMRTDKIVKWEAPVNKTDFAVSYTYRLENIAPWATAPALLQAVPKVAIWINGAQKTERKNFVKVTPSGLEAINDKGI